MRVLAVLSVLFVLPAFANEGPLFKIYQDYVKAIDNSDLAAAKKFLSSGKLKHLEEMNAEEALGQLNVISPKENLRPHKEFIEDDDATLVVVAEVAENESAGRIQFAREDGQWKILSEMWDIGGDPDEMHKPGRQPKNDTERAAIRKLREAGFPDPSEEFLVMSAVDGKVDVLKLFIEAGYSPNAKSSQGTPAIVNAAMFGKAEAVLYLMEAGADINAADGNNTTALMRLADKCEATDVIRELLKAGARTDLKSAGGATAEQMAEWASCKDNLAAIRKK